MKSVSVIPVTKHASITCYLCGRELISTYLGFNLKDSHFIIRNVPKSSAINKFIGLKMKELKVRNPKLSFQPTIKFESDFIGNYRCINFE